VLLADMDSVASRAGAAIARVHLPDGGPAVCRIEPMDFLPYELCLDVLSRLKLRDAANASQVPDRTRFSSMRRCTHLTRQL
jgi:hypothetical protein